MILPFKANHCFAMLDLSGFADAALPRVAGMFLYDTRHLSDYRWDFSGFDLIEAQETLTEVTQFWSRFVHHEQDLLIQRTLRFRPDGFDDVLSVRNESLTEQVFTPQLTADADFVDCFELRGRVRAIGRNRVDRTTDAAGTAFTYLAQDGIRTATTLRFSGFSNGAGIVLAPGQSVDLAVRGDFATTLPGVDDGAPLPGFQIRATSAVQQQALADITALTCSSPQGVYVAAGVPNFVTLFGRDSLITAWFLLHAAPGLARSTLLNLAQFQGTVDNPARAEQPGKIPHEIRQGELSRCDDVPFGRYYGTTDATALFVMVLRDTHDPGLARTLEPHWRSALDWIEGQQDAQGLIRYGTARVGRGLVHTSWKDSDDSVSYADGRLATGQIAVVEIQGYVAAALLAGAELNDALGGPPAETLRLRAKAAALRLQIDALFWNDRLGLHAIAVDAAGAQCDTATSNPGHLLWAGVLSPDRAWQVADRLMQPDLWSGWGLRTLSTREKRYKPLSYHNGSVWPHDTGLFAAGLHRYGLTGHCNTVCRALLALAARQPGLHMPELLGGYARSADIPPLVYVETCRPQAWAAAAVIWAASHQTEKD